MDIPPYREAVGPFLFRCQHSRICYACRWLEKTFVVSEPAKPNGDDA
jgi:hypothetical protein